MTVPRDLMYWSLRKRKVPEKLIRLVKATYKKATTVVRTAHGKTGQFEIEVGLHQGSDLSPFLFTIVLDTISEECRNGLPWELLFADDLAIIDDSEEELQRRWLKWQIGLESKGLKVNTGKTAVMVSGRNRTKVNIKDKEGRELNQVDQFKYIKELGVGSIKSKARESRLRWFGHVHRREQESNLRQVMDMEVPGRRPRGRPRGRWCDLVDRDMRELRVGWKMQTTEIFGDDGYGPPTPPWDKAQEVK
ncbi:RNA-directed DNA polymerase (Reverse transcriptase) domain containing protein [Elysia marginata]|uniref:RNA-directed DNA polymerase (Reverse transcriptase) domain containing protein n=1 Tax=Elysia marginata TaxID=1093978 RepID=A0AAV4FDN7_9GAST|nr:RNA-directed DNA polymerase (Reverse transcriptase) domain containing protein [Elysia marginata]